MVGYKKITDKRPWYSKPIHPVAARKDGCEYSYRLPSLLLVSFLLPIYRVLTLHPCLAGLLTCVPGNVFTTDSLRSVINLGSSQSNYIEN